MAAKQKAAAQFAGSFVPKTRFGVVLRNQITKAFAIPFVAKLTLGRSLLDRIDLPSYPSQGKEFRRKDIVLDELVDFWMFHAKT
jgi:hypothetical protein